MRYADMTEERKKREREYSKRYREKHKERVRAYDKRYKEKHKERDRAIQREYYKKVKDTEEFKKRIKETYLKNRDKNLERAKTYRKRRVESMSDSYIRAKLAANTIAKPKDFPQALVNSKRAELKLKRLIREKKKCQNKLSSCQQRHLKSSQFSN